MMSDNAINSWLPVTSIKHVTSTAEGFDDYDAGAPVAGVT